MNTAQRCNSGKSLVVDQRCIRRWLMTRVRGILARDRIGCSALNRSTVTAHVAWQALYFAAYLLLLTEIIRRWLLTFQVVDSGFCWNWITGFPLDRCSQDRCSQERKTAQWWWNDGMSVSWPKNFRWLPAFCLMALLHFARVNWCGCLLVLPHFARVSRYGQIWACLLTSALNRVNLRMVTALPQSWNLGKLRWRRSCSWTWTLSLSFMRKNGVKLNWRLKVWNLDGKLEILFYHTKLREAGTSQKTGVMSCYNRWWPLGETRAQRFVCRLVYRHDGVECAAIGLGAICLYTPSVSGVAAFACGWQRFERLSRIF